MMNEEEFKRLFEAQFQFEIGSVVKHLSDALSPCGVVLSQILELGKSGGYERWYYIGFPTGISRHHELELKFIRKVKRP